MKLSRDTLISLAIVGVLIGTVWAIIHAAPKHDGQAENAAIVECKLMGGTPVLTYHPNSGFYLTGCKL